LKEINLNEENFYDKYLSYLESKTWADKRNEALKRDDYHCVICGNPNNLEVHHLRYPDILGTELISDLMTLCRSCHKNMEEYKKGHKVSSLTRYWIPPQKREFHMLNFETQKDYEDFLSNESFFEAPYYIYLWIYIGKKSIHEEIKVNEKAFEYIKNNLEYKVEERWSQ
jgi:hypothetical protein